MSLEKLNELVKVNLEEFSQFLSKAKPDDYYGLKFRIQTIEIIRKNFDNAAAKQLADPRADEGYGRTSALFEERLGAAHAMAKRFEEARESAAACAAGTSSASCVDDFERVRFRRAEEQPAEEARAMPSVYDFDKYWEYQTIPEMSESADDVAEDLEKIKLQRDRSEPGCSSASGAAGDDACASTSRK